LHICPPLKAFEAHERNCCTHARVRVRVRASKVGLPDGGAARFHDDQTAVAKKRKDMNATLKGSAILGSVLLRSVLDLAIL